MLGALRMTLGPAPFTWNFCAICGSSLTPRHDGEAERPHCASCRRFYYYNPVPAVCCVVASAEGLLFARRGIEPCLGEWCLPGGFVEVTETVEQAAARELAEETGLEALEVSLIGTSSQQSRFYGTVLVLGFAITQWRGTPRPGSDVTELRFYSREARPPLPFLTHRELLARYDARAGGG